MLDSVNDNISKIREKGREVAAQAAQAAETAQQTATRVGLNGKIRGQINDAQRTVQDLIDQIEAMKKRVTGERADASKELDKVLAAVDQAKSEVNRLIGQIQEKERTIEELSNKVIHQNVWPLGEISLPDPEALLRAGGIRVEIAGLHGALGTAQAVLANTMQSMDALQAYVVHTPIEADPRLTQLYSKLQAEQQGITAILAPATLGTEKPFRAVLSDENKSRIAEIASRQINTGMPDSVEQDLFLDAIEKVEKALVEAVPEKVLNLMWDAAEGLSGDTAKYVARITHRVNKVVDIPMLDEQEEAEFFALLINLLVDSMAQGNDLETALSKA